MITEAEIKIKYLGPYDADFFLGFFSAIPDHRWGRLVFYEKSTGSFCALGACRLATVPRSRWTTHLDANFLSKALEAVLGQQTVHINDGRDFRYRQDTPKARILAALKDAKKAGQ